MILNFVKVGNCLRPQESIMLEKLVMHIGPRSAAGPREFSQYSDTNLPMGTIYKIHAIQNYYATLFCCKRKYLKSQFSEDFPRGDLVGTHHCGMLALI